jgi:hypothetical protein
VSRTAHRRSIISAMLVIGIAAACNPDTPTGVRSTETGIPVSQLGGVRHSDAQAALDAVNAGNAQMIATAPRLVPPGAPLAPFVEARLYAVTTIAMHDALNAIIPRFERYADTGPVDSKANPGAAVLTAAHDAMVGANPDAGSEADSWYASQMSALNGTAGVEEGVAIGHRVASAILAMRANDGTAGGGVAPYAPGPNAGDYQFTFPFNTPGFDFFGTGGFADASEWGNLVTPFVILSTSQFRAGKPYGANSNAEAVQTAQYTRDFNEIKSLGCSACPARSAEQTEIAEFWVESSCTGWNRMASTLAAGRHLDAWDTARLYALLEIGVFDAYATSLETKYHYNFWRPVSAVALADNDGNPSTSTAAGWEVLVFPTPPVPDYPSAHAEVGSTAGTILEAIVPGRGPVISTTSATLPGVTRSFATIEDAIRENGLSRIYVGYHFRHAVDVGIAQGRKIGEYIASNGLKPTGR